MARITSNHKDCYIDCPGDGYAYYVEPYGPCEAGCDITRAGDVLADAIINHGDRAKFSGRVRGITTPSISKFAEDIVGFVRAPQNPEFQFLRRVGSVAPILKVNASWELADVEGILSAIIDSFRNGPIYLDVPRRQ